MFINEFPNLSQLKDNIKKRFENNMGWPNVIINAKTTNEYRPNIKGTLSLFMNLQGESICKVNNTSHVINKNSYFVSNNLEEYTLEIDSKNKTETFNIHISEEILKSVYQQSVYSSSKLLESFDHNAASINFMHRLFAKDEFIQNVIEQLGNAKLNNTYSSFLEDELLYSLTKKLMNKHIILRNKIESVTDLKKKTREEIVKKLMLSLDFMHSKPYFKIELDELAKVACISKFHYIRLFKLIFSVSPYQYIQQLKINRSLILLKKKVPIQEIAIELGFENPQSFSLFFKKYQLLAPKYYY